MKADSEMTALNDRNAPPGGCSAGGCSCGRRAEAFSVSWRNKPCSEFANTTFAATKKQAKHNKKKDTVMKTKNTVSSVITAVTQSKWIRPAVMTLALLVAVLGGTGCNGTNDSGNHGDHGMHGN
jgi:hypothetical protein